MADDHKAPAPGATGAAHPAKSAMSGLIGVVAGGLVLVLVGAGAGLYIAKMFQTAPATAGENAHKTEHAEDAGVDPLNTKELALGELITNVTGDSHRYIKITCAIWVTSKDAHHLEPTGVEGEIQIPKLVRMALEERLKAYDLTELTGRGIISQMSTEFQVVIENTLHAQFPDEPKEHRFVKKVILNNLLVQ